MRLILSQACTLLAPYVEYGLCATDARVANAINLAIERLLPMMNPEKTIGRYQFDVVNNTITCPREVKTILQASTYYQACTGGNCGPGCTSILKVKSRWYEMLPGGPAGFHACAENIIRDIGTGYSTFADPSTDNPLTLRLYADLPQPASEGFLVVVGQDAAGNDLVSYQNNQWIPGMALPIPIQGENYVDATLAVSQILSISKPQTVGRLRLFGVDSTGVQTALAVYQPDEINPDYRRYMLSWFESTPAPAILTVLAKKRFYWAFDPYEDLLITNVGALQNALMAMKYEKSGTFDQAAACWKTAGSIINVEDDDYDGDYSASVQMQENWGGGDIWSLR